MRVAGPAAEAAAVGAAAARNGLHASAPTSRVSATARVRAEQRGGRTRYPVLQSDPPLTLRRTGDTVHLVGTTAGPLGGDELALSIDVGAGAVVDLRSSAAQLIHPGVHGAVSALATDVSVAQAAFLRFLPEPTILLPGCHHRGHSSVSVDTGGSLVWAEVVVRGRHRESGGSACFRLDLEQSGSTVLRTEVCTGPAFPDADGPAGTNSAKAFASVLFVGHDPPDPKQLLGTRADRAVRVGMTRVDSAVHQVVVVSDSVGALTDVVRTLATGTR